MNLIGNRAMEIGAMALDGLYERSKAISSNTANAMTPNYKRREVSFEASLRNIIEREDEKENIKLQNSTKVAKEGSSALLGQSPKQIALLNTEINEDYSISVDVDNEDGYSIDGNNVNIESEMMDEAKTGMQYQVLSNLLSKSYSNLRDVIKGQNQ